MSRYSIEDTTLSAIGDAIREKTGRYTKIENSEVRDFFTFTSPAKTWPAAPSFAKPYEFNQIKMIINHYEGDISTIQFRMGSQIIEFDENNESLHSGNYYSAGYGDWRITPGVRNTGDTDFYIEYTLIPMLDGNPIYVETEVPNLIAPGNMPDEIRSIETGGTELPEEALNISHSCEYRFIHGKWDWFINTFGNQVNTNNIDNANSMFYGCNNLSNIPFTLNFAEGQNVDTQTMFAYCYSLTELPAITNLRIQAASYMFNECHSLREISPNFLNGIDYSYVEDDDGEMYKGSLNSVFASCYSLRTLPMDFIRKMHNPYGEENSSFLSEGFVRCYVLDEATNLPVGDMYDWMNDTLCNTVQNCHRLKNFTFEVNEDGTPKTARWAYQNLDFTQDVGYTNYSGNILNYNSGITEDKEVKDDATYQALKNDPDWFTTNIAYSRYNHDSAVATINSLPDCSAFIEELGDGTNTITFRGDAGSATDGGAINNLTEEEIAVAAAKGWTVVIE